MTLLTPILIAGFYGMIIYFSIQGAKGTFSKIAVVSTNKTLTEKLISNKNITYVYVNQTLAQLKPALGRSTFDYILYLPDFNLNKPAGIQLLGIKQVGLPLNAKVEEDINNLIRSKKLKESGISQKDLDLLKSSVSIDNKKIDTFGKDKDSSAGATMIVGTASGILMFFFILIYGIQVMRGVIEEKTSRIIEVMISSVKPFQLMMGKIIGIALVGLTQFMLWIVLTLAISTIAVKTLVDKKDSQQTTAITAQVKAHNIKSISSSSPLDNIQKSLANLDKTKIIWVFLFFFLGGYLFYSALYAAIGSAVDNETETQQFMMPVMMPLALSYGLSLSVINSDPYGTIAFWLSMIPFTSPIAMMVRLPYGVPDWQLALSMALLIFGFVGTVWVASRIYRVGILMYGKKPSFKEMIKWFAYKN